MKSSPRTRSSRAAAPAGLRTKVLFGSLALPVALAAALAQEPLRPVAGGQESARDAAPLAPLAPEDEPVAPLELEFEIRAALTDIDLDAREAAFDQWAARAAGEPAVRSALEVIAADDVERDVAFVARLALREADRAAAPRRPGPRFGPNGRFVDPFDAMRTELESAFGPDLFGPDPFANDPFFRGGRTFPGFGGVDPRGGTPDPFTALERRREALQERLDRMFGQDPLGGVLGGRGARSMGTSIQIGPDGVRVEIVESGENGPETRTYEAPSVEVLLEEHPELRGIVR